MKRYISSRFTEAPSLTAVRGGVCPMNSPIPRYRLFCESSDRGQEGRWRFVLRDADGRERLVAADVEPEVRGERLELLTVVRALEALEHPARITLMTPSVYVREGIRYGLSQWRSDS